jgi:hypothetical protein
MIRMRLIILTFDMNHRIFGPYLAALHRILISVVRTATHSHTRVQAEAAGTSSQTAEAG